MQTETPTNVQAEDAASVRADVDPDRGTLVGVGIGLAMQFLLQGMIAGAFQLATQGKGEWFAPLRFAGFTQLMYVAPTVLLFVNRRCPRMAKGVGLVAVGVFVGNVVGMLV